MSARRPKTVARPRHREALGPGGAALAPDPPVLLPPRLPKLCLLPPARRQSTARSGSGEPSSSSGRRRRPLEKMEQPARLPVCRPGRQSRRQPHLRRAAHAPPLRSPRAASSARQGRSRQRSRLRPNWANGGASLLPSGGSESGGKGGGGCLVSFPPPAAPVWDSRLASGGASWSSALYYMLPRERSDGLSSPPLLGKSLIWQDAGNTSPPTPHPQTACRSLRSVFDY